MKQNWYGFLSWMGDMDGVRWRDVDEYDKATAYDLVWMVTPEFPHPSKRLTMEQHANYLKGVIAQMKPKVGPDCLDGGGCREWGGGGWSAARRAALKHGLLVRSNAASDPQLDPTNRPT